MKDAGRIGFVIRGPYSALAQYEFLDVVYYGDASYVAKKDASGVAPEDESEFWQVLVKGKSDSGAVIGVKGAEETEYRTGKVSISKANIGLGKVANATPEEIRSGMTKEKIESILGYNPSEITITVDSALDKTSENPVQNKAIARALAEKGDTLVYDEATNKLHLKSGETILSTAIVEGGAETEAIQSWGSRNVIGNESSIAVGDDNVIAPDAEGAVTFGGNNKMNKMYTFSAGMLNEVNTIGSIALGRLNVIPASAKTYALAIGIKNKPTAAFGSAIGVSLEQDAYGGFACGRWNAVREAVGNDSEARGDAFVVGNGNSAVRGNAFRVSHSGDAYALKAVNSSGADYAEFIKPWADNNPDGEDRVGYFVTVRDGFLHKANAGDYIAGITSGNPSVVGNADEDYYWKYERDAFGRIVLEEIPERVQALDGEGAPMFDENGETVLKPTGGTVKRMKLSADYDKTLQGSYEERKNRPEWDYVGMLGVLPVRDDGTCIPGLFCKCGAGGIATLSTERGVDAYMVIERLADGVVKVILR